MGSKRISIELKLAVILVITLLIMCAQVLIVGTVLHGGVSVQQEQGNIISAQPSIPTLNTLAEPQFKIGDIICKKDLASDSILGELIVFSKDGYYGRVDAYNGLDHTWKQYNKYQSAWLSEWAYTDKNYRKLGELGGGLTTGY